MDINGFLDHIRTTIDELKLQASKQVVEPLMQKPQGYNPLTQALKLGVPATQLPEVLQQFVFNPQTKRLFPQSPLYPENQPDLTANRVTPQSLTRTMPFLLMSAGMQDVSKPLPKALTQVTAPVEEASFVKQLPAPLSFLQKPKTPVAIEGVEPVMNTKRAVPITDIHGQKAIIPAGEPLTPYRISGNKILVKDSDEYILNKNQFQNLKGNAIESKAQPFAPELAQTTETIKGKIFSGDAKKRYNQLVELRQNATGEELTKITEEQNNLERIIGSQEETKYSQYTLPGGENYREILIQSPLNEADLTKRGFYLIDGENGGVQLVDREGVSRGTWPDKQLAMKSMVRETGFKGGHWDEPNVLAHVRMNDRLTPDGKKVAFMEEAQSDWAREARANPKNSGELDQWKAELQTAKDYKRKYLNLLNEKYGTARTLDALAEFADKFTPEEKTILKNYNDQITNAQTRINEVKDYVSTHPLLKNWQELSIKRALKDAVDSNADYFSWTTGSQQAARYNLSKQVEDISWHKVAGTPTKTVFIQPKGDISNIQVEVDQTGKIVTTKGQLQAESWAGKQLDQVIGKGISEKIMGGNSGKLSGEGLNIGGEWAYNLYDRQIPNIVEDLTGQKPKMMDLGLSSGSKDIPEFYIPNTNPAGGTTGGIKVTYASAKPGMKIVDTSGNEMIITGKFGGKINTVDANPSMNVLNDRELYDRAVSKGYLGKHNDFQMDDATEAKMFQDPDILGMLNRSDYSTEYDLSIPSGIKQQVIQLTPEIKAKIRGEAIPLKQPSGKPPMHMTEEALKPNLPQPPVSSGRLGELNQKAIKKFGVRNPEDAGNIKGFLTPKGEVINVGGSNSLGDHSEVAPLMGKRQGDLKQNEDIKNAFMQQSGSARIYRNADDVGIEFSQPINENQIQTIKKTLLPDGGDFYWDGPTKTGGNFHYDDIEDGLRQLRKQIPIVSNVAQPPVSDVPVGKVRIKPIKGQKTPSPVQTSAVPEGKTPGTEEELKAALAEALK